MLTLNELNERLVLIERQLDKVAAERTRLRVKRSRYRTIVKNLCQIKVNLEDDKCDED